MKKVLLISPRKIVEKRGTKRIVPPLGLAYIGAVLEENNFNVKILDVALEGYNTEEKKDNKIIFGLSDYNIIQKIKDFNPDYVGVSMSLSLYSKEALNICRLVKETNKNIIVIVGGVHASFASKELIKDKNIDYIIKGEGEYSFLNILKGECKNKIIK